MNLYRIFVSICEAFFRSQEKKEYFESYMEDVLIPNHTLKFIQLQN
jgi:hypothetical protein